LRELGAERRLVTDLRRQSPLVRLAQSERVEEEVEVAGIGIRGPAFDG
jgi:hypothetical protein